MSNTVADAALARKLLCKLHGKHRWMERNSTYSWVFRGELCPQRHGLTHIGLRCSECDKRYCRYCKQQGQWPLHATQYGDYKPVPAKD